MSAAEVQQIRGVVDFAGRLDDIRDMARIVFDVLAWCALMGGLGLLLRLLSGRKRQE